MAKARFRRAIENVARPMLEPLGFSMKVDNEPGYGGLYSFVKAWKGDWNQAIGFQTSRISRAFAIEIGVVRGGLWWAASSEVGPWREIGLRRRLGLLLHPKTQGIDPYERDFCPYSDQASLETAMRNQIEFVLVHAPSAWERMGDRLLKKE
jgi:hypothetical protein